MQTPLQVTYRGVAKTESLDGFIRQRVNKLHRFADDIISCRVAVERPQKHQQSGNPFRVRIEVTMPPAQDLVAVKDPRDHEPHDQLPTVLRNAFEAMERQVKETAQRRRRNVKRHDEPIGYITKLFRDDGYGFLTTPDGTEIYFHKHSVLADDFERLAIGTGVRYAEEMGAKGVQASSVRIVDKPGVGPSDDGDSPLP